MASARSTMPIARSTPAQKPRGLARRTSMIPILGLLRGAGRAQPVEDQQRRAHRNSRIGEIESPEMPAEGVEVEKIHDVAEGDPVPEIAERSAEDQGKSSGENQRANASSAGTSGVGSATYGSPRRPRPRPGPPSRGR